MSTLSIKPPFVTIQDTDGQPLQNGYIWIGTANLDPIANPINVYWDSALTLQAAQPIRTINGFPARNGSPGTLYVSGNYSIQVQNKNGSVVYSAASVTENVPSTVVTFTQSGTGAEVRSVENKLNEFVSVTDFGADPTGAADSTAAIQAAINSLPATGGRVIFPTGIYKTDSIVTLVSNLTLEGDGGATLKPSDSIAQWAYKALSKNNITIKNLVFEGSGTAYTDGNQQLLHLASVNGFVITGCTFKKARITGLLVADSQNGHVSDCNFFTSYFYGADIRDSSNITVDSCVFELNGNTGTASSAFGRGLVLWRCANSTVANSVFHQNTEYGLRLYSEAADVTANRNIAITGCAFRDNGTTATSKIDLYCYDDAKLIERVAITGCTFSTRTGNTAAVLSGREITFTGNTVKAISPQTITGVSLYGSTNTVVNGNVFHGTSNIVAFSSTVGAVSTNCTVSNNQCIDTVTFTTVQGTGHIISGNNITHGGAGVTDVGITITSANVSAVISGNTLSSFYRGFNVASTGGVIVIKDNTTLSSSDTGFYAKFQTDVSGIVCTNNNFDSSYPTSWATMHADSLHSFGRRFFIANATPATAGEGGGANIVWKVGDRVYNSAPSAGQPKSWVCTVAGAPGTWTSEGNL